MLFEPGERPVQFCRCLAVGCVGGLGRGEVSEIVSYPILGDLSIPGAPTAVRLKVDALVSGSIVSLASLVAKIIAMGCRSKVPPGKVGPPLVHVVDLVLRPLTGHPEPRKPMGHIPDAPEADDQITVWPVTPGRLPYPPPRWAVFAPREHARFWVIVQGCSHLFCGDVVARLWFACHFVISHSTLLWSLWSGAIKGARNTLSLRHFAEAP